jgi:hypothetical protein
MSVPVLGDGMVLRFAGDASVVFDPTARTLQVRRDMVRRVWTDVDAAAETLVASLREGMNSVSLEAWRRKRAGPDLLEVLLADGIVQAVTSLPAQGRSAATLAYLAIHTPEPQRALSTAQSICVAVVGLGGLGCEVIRHLAALGIRELVCVDHDRVEPSNLNRQLCYTPADVGRCKADAIRDYLNRHSPETRVTVSHEFVRTEADLHGALRGVGGEPPRLIACCADEPVGEVELACLGVSRKLVAAFAFTAMQVGRGYWGLLVSDHAMARAEAFFRAARDLRARVNTGVFCGSASWENSLLAAHLCDAIVRRLAGLPPRKPLDRMTSLDFAGPAATILADFQDGTAPAALISPDMQL